MVSSISMKKTETTGIPMSHSRTVLIIEDNRDIREMYVLSFRSRGYSVHEASDWLAGIAQAAEIRPGVIILDIMMPHMDGFEVLHTLKHNTSIHPIIIVNSNLEWVDEERKVKELGADHFLRKSQYTPLEVVDFIEKEIFRIT
jgi:CheY-like chemotaxis protein